MKAITPDSSTIICGLTDTVSTPAHFWPATDIPGYLVRLLYLQMQNIRQERHIENKNRNNFKSVQTPVMRMSSSGYDAHKRILIAPHTFSPLLSTNSYEWFGKPGYSYTQKLCSSPSRDGQQRKKKENYPILLFWILAIPFTNSSTTSTRHGVVWSAAVRKHHRLSSGDTKDIRRLKRSYSLLAESKLAFLESNQRWQPSTEEELRVAEVSMLISFLSGQ